MNDFLMHYGVAHDEDPPGRGSGRYPFGQGNRPLQHAWEFRDRVDKLNGQGYSEKEIARMMGLYKLDNNGNPVLDAQGVPEGSIKRLRAAYQTSKNTIRTEGWEKTCIELSNTINPETGKLYTNTEIGRKLGINEGSVRNYIRNTGASDNARKTIEIANELKARIADGGYLDVGRGAEEHLGCSRDRLDIALEMLKEEGYGVREVYNQQVTGTMGQMTIIKTLYPPGVEYREVVKNRAQIKSVEQIDGDRSMTMRGTQYPTEVDLSRVKVKYAEDGGTDRDGLIEIRAIRGEDGELYPACPDLSLGNAKYAQVRIAVDASSEGLGSRYVKGMAVYNADLPEGTDIRVNSNKHTLDKALKKMETLPDGSINRDNPFGTTVYQSDYIPGKLSAINIVGDVNGIDKHVEGAWNEWNRNMPSQFLSKQSETLIKQQLKLKVQEKEAEYDQIISVNNPILKQQLLIDFGEACDKAATDLKAAPIAGQRVQVLLPVPSLKDNEIYAPNYDNGQTVALVRFPHAGPFETPILKVNNGNKEARSFMKEANDAVGINHHVAETLSGADFDGDTVIVIPMTRKNSQGEFSLQTNIKGVGNGVTRLPDMDGFDPQAEYPEVPGMKVMTKKQKGIEMGVVSNLITDMSIKGCEDPKELARAVKYSMVVIDAQKHRLNWKQAEKDYNIKELKEKYQVNKDGTHGVSTLLSRAGSEIDVDQRQMGYSIDKETGEKVYKPAPHRFYQKTDKVRLKDENGKYLKDENGNYIYETWPNGKIKKVPTGETAVRQQKVSRMSNAKNAYELLSDNPTNKEIIYADYANHMKVLGNKARKEAANIESYKVDPEAKKLYSNEVNSLNVKLSNAKKNSTRERQAQLLATQMVNIQRDENPDMDNDDLKKYKGFAINYARNATGASKDRVIFTEKEWEAVNAHAVAPSTFKDLLKNGDKSNYMDLALPKSDKISRSTANYILSLLDAGWTREEIESAGYASRSAIDAAQAGRIDS